MKKLKEILVTIGGYIFVAVLFLLNCLECDTNEKGNFYDCRMTKNKYARLVAQKCMPDADPITEEEGVVLYITTFDEEEKEDADKMFYSIIKNICDYHVGKQVKVDYGNHSEKIFLCYDEDISILVWYKKINTKFDYSFYAIDIEYVDTDLYDWDYLSSRIK